MCSMQWWGRVIKQVDVRLTHAPPPPPFTHRTHTTHTPRHSNTAPHFHPPLPPPAWHDDGVQSPPCVRRHFRLKNSVQTCVFCSQCMLLDGDDASADDNNDNDNDNGTTTTAFDHLASCRGCPGHLLRLLCASPNSADMYFVDTPAPVPVPVPAPAPTPRATTADTFPVTMAPVGQPHAHAATPSQATVHVARVPMEATIGSGPCGPDVHWGPVQVPVPAGPGYPVSPPRHVVHHCQQHGGTIASSMVAPLPPATLRWMSPPAPPATCPARRPCHHHRCKDRTGAATRTPTRTRTRPSHGAHRRTAVAV